jgi:hypothetical protein
LESIALVVEGTLVLEKILLEAAVANGLDP